jgi:hypothetical protein
MSAHSFKLAEGVTHFETGWIDGRLLTITGDAVLGTDDPRVVDFLERQDAVENTDDQATFTFNTTPPEEQAAQADRDTQVALLMKLNRDELEAAAAASGVEDPADKELYPTKRELAGAIADAETVA